MKTVKRLNYQRLYDRLAPFYAPAMRLLPVWLRYAQQVLPWLDQKQAVLEIGPGPGVLHQQIARSHAFTAGLDLSLAMLRYAQRRLLRQALTPHLVQARAMQLPFADGAFEGIVLTFVFSAIPDGAAALREMHRVLCPNGVLALVDACVPEGGNLIARGLGQMWKLFGDSLRDEAMLMRAAGFNVVERKEFGVFHSVRLTVASKM
jgi:ubiquinone/menaquinone biosynthesis C-methylase UbiE